MQHTAPKDDCNDRAGSLSLRYCRRLDDHVTVTNAASPDRVAVNAIASFQPSTIDQSILYLLQVSFDLIDSAVIRRTHHLHSFGSPISVKIPWQPMSCTALYISDSENCKAPATSLNGLCCSLHSKKCQGSSACLSQVRILLITM